MQKLVRKYYIRLVAPAVALLLLEMLLFSFHRAPLLTPDIRSRLAPFIFLSAVAFGLAFPIFYRSWTVYRMRNVLPISNEQFLNYQKRFLQISLVTPYLADLAFLIQLPSFHLVGTFLLALYAVYYYYPSRKRLLLDMRIFKMETELENGGHD